MNLNTDGQRHPVLNSATCEKRALIVTGVIAGLVGLALGLAHSAFSG